MNYLYFNSFITQLNTFSIYIYLIILNDQNCYKQKSYPVHKMLKIHSSMFHHHQPKKIKRESQS